jgi:hypothetical protein
MSISKLCSSLLGPKNTYFTCENIGFKPSMLRLMLISWLVTVYAGGTLPIDFTVGPSGHYGDFKCKSFM